MALDGWIVILLHGSCCTAVGQAAVSSPKLVVSRCPQAIGRLFRYGQKRATFIYRLLYNGGIQVGAPATVAGGMLCRMVFSSVHGSWELVLGCAWPRATQPRRP